MKYEIAPKSTEIQANWYDAKLYCFALNIDGKTGWRLPTIEELNEIYQSENDFEAWSYWSSTEGDDKAWKQGFNGGSQHFYFKFYSRYYVRAVRANNI